MSNKIRIALAENHAILRNTMAGMFNKENGMEVVLDVENGKELVEKLSSVPVDVVLLDLDMPVMDGREALYIINRRFPKIKILILSMHFTRQHLEKFISKGASGYLSKETDYFLLVDAIKNVYTNKYHFDENVTQELINRIEQNKIKKTKFIQDDPLSKREIQILKYICDQKTSIEIADDLKLSRRTVENHRKNIAKKTGVKNGVGLIEYAIKKGYYEVKL